MFVPSVLRIAVMWYGSSVRPSVCIRPMDALPGRVGVFWERKPPERILRLLVGRCTLQKPGGG